MRTLAKAAAVAIGLLTASAPLAAEAQSRHDRREWRQDRRHDNRDWRREYRQDQRDWRRDHRQDRRDHRDDRRAQHWNRGDPNWWRSRSDFRGYNGPRNGHYFAPGYGYYRVEPRYSRHRWQRGHVLPSAYRGYYVRDPYAYDLRPAPRGYRWVHVNSDIVLIALATGLIADVVLNVY